MSKIKEVSVMDEVNELLNETKNITENVEEITEITENNEKPKEKEVVYSDITLQILGIAEQLTILDDYFNELPNLQSKIDEELSDLLHYIENNQLTPKQSTKMIKLIQQKRLVRRGLLKDYEMKKVYNTYKGKMTIDTQRDFFLMEIYKKAKELNSQYRYRQFGIDKEDTLERKTKAEEEIKALLK